MSVRNSLVLMVAASLCACGGSGSSAPAPQEGGPKTEATAKSSAEVERITTKTGVDMVRIPAGAFRMGSDNGGDDEQPVHEVKVGAFLMDVYEVTQKDFEALMGQNPAKFKDPTHPVEQLGWFSAIKYCNTRSMREGLTPCYDLDTAACNLAADGYRLPTEAEWEYACRAGSDTAYSFGDEERQLGSRAWFDENAEASTKPVGQKTPNAWGLYDMHGNVWEWCTDVYSENAYETTSGPDPCNQTEGEGRVLRGGGWDSPAELCRSATRYSEEPGLADVCFGYEEYGFRCVRREKATEAVAQ
ncbi:MAG: formylglycine-generating enzyme family protein [Candidatus Hydrogenedentes bacterium]|nr:formylglycine-generating enzyme family protein [Candidatus Hydrogenedentota bacterium]